MDAIRVRFGAPLIPALRPVLLAMLILALTVSSPAQLIIGQYEDEAPLRSWNTFGLAAASSLGRGETQLAWTEDCSAALANPALLLSLSKLTVCLSGSFSNTSLYSYSIVNTGVLVTEKNPTIGLHALDFGGVSFRFNGWAFALTGALIESYDRPGASAKTYFQSLPYYEISFGQTGYLRNFNLAVARAFGRSVRAGIGFNLVRGQLNREVFDRDFSEDITISHIVDQEFSGFYINAGALFRLTGRLDLACVVRTPYDKKADGRSRLRYKAPGGGTDILIEAASDDRSRQPWTAGLGVHGRVSEDFRITGDLVYFFWSRYRAEFFGESERRDFRDTFKIAAGGEYFLRLRLFGREAAIPLRLGMAYDRQPMREPGSAYLNLTFGTGIRWRAVVFDVGALGGRESGSGHSLKTLRVAASLGIRL